MPTFREFKLPDLGEGLTEAEILKWLVQPGDEVVLNQPIVEVETAKAAVEIPSPYAGLVTALHHDEGDAVDVGAPIITFEIASELAAEAQPAPDRNPESTSAVSAKSAASDRIEILVGSGPKSGRLTRRPRKHQTGTAPPAPAAGNGSRLLAKPPMRRLARDLGVDLSSLRGSGPGGSISRADVEAAAGQHAGQALTGSRVPDAVSFPTHVAREERIPIRGVRKQMAATMVTSAYSAPHVTVFATADVTPTMNLVDRLRTTPNFAEVRVSPLLVVAKALLIAVKRCPLINSTWDEQAQEIVVKNYVNLGIAAATPRGLIVPNIKDAQSLTLPELGRAMSELVTTARDGTTAVAALQGGTISITNVGVFGVDTGTPILNPGEAAILCFGVVRDAAWVHEGDVAIRKITQLALSFDHRIVDGQLGSQFLGDVAAMLSDPTLLLAWS